MRRRQCQDPFPIVVSLERPIRQVKPRDSSLEEKEQASLRVDDSSGGPFRHPPGAHFLSLHIPHTQRSTGIPTRIESRHPCAARHASPAHSRDTLASAFRYPCIDVSPTLQRLPGDPYVLPGPLQRLSDTLAAPFRTLASTFNTLAAPFRYPCSDFRTPCIDVSKPCIDVSIPLQRHFDTLAVKEDSPNVTSASPCSPSASPVRTSASPCHPSAPLRLTSVSP